MKNTALQMTKTALKPTIQSGSEESLAAHSIQVQFLRISFLVQPNLRE